MTQYFVLLGAKDRKISLENAKHRCPKCKHHNSVQLTRFENELIVWNRKIGLPNHMNVLYNCDRCNWRNKVLPDDDSLFSPVVLVELTCTETTVSPSFSSGEDLSRSSPNLSIRSSIATCWRKKGLSLKRKIF